jgi:hypothetical protein
MRILDERGRIFGRINIFDVVIFLILISSVFFVHRFFKFSENPPIVKKYTEGSTNIELTVKNVMPEIVSSIKRGDIVKDENGRVILEVISMLADEPARLGSFELPGAVRSGITGEPNRDIKLLLKIIYFKRYGRPVATINGVYLVLGASFYVLADKYTLTGVITKIGDTDEERRPL